jgi:RES domain-containing protein
MVISLPDDELFYREIKIRKLSDNWRKISGYSELQELGSNWYNKNESLILKVPSSVIPYEFNYVINTEHQDFKKKVKLVRTEDYFWDKRLI